MVKKYRKYNWKALKINYFKSDEPFVRNFLEDNFTKVNGHMLKMTTGWYKEKVSYEEKKQLEISKRQMDRVSRKVAKEVAKKYRSKRLRELGMA